MNKFSIKRLKKVFPRLYATKRLIFEKSSYLYETGWFKSLKKEYPCKRSGEELPWMNYAVIAFLQNRLNRSMRLFEFGSGYSTIFYAKLVDNVIAVEHNAEWFDVITDRLPSNAKVIYHEKIEKSNYCKATNAFNQKFDVIVVDGFDRVNCMLNALSSLKDNGVLILDDSRRASYQEGIDYYERNGFKSLKFEGIKPTGVGLDITTVLYRVDNCFNI